MTPLQLQCLKALYEETAPNGDRCVSFSVIQDHTRLDRRTVRRNVRALARSGYAEYFKGLFTEDGGMAGAGYCITRSGTSKMQMIDAGHKP